MDKHAQLRKTASVFLDLAVKSNHVAWYGYQRSRHGWNYVNRPKEHFVIYQGVRKVFGGHKPLQITFRRECMVPWFIDFDRSKHEYWFEIIVEDILGISGFRKLVTVNLEKTDPEFSALDDIFTQLWGSANFIQGGKASGNSVAAQKQQATASVIEELNAQPLA